MTGPAPKTTDGTRKRKRRAAVKSPSTRCPAARLAREWLDARKAADSLDGWRSLPLDAGRTNAEQTERYHHDKQEAAQQMLAMVDTKTPEGALVQLLAVADYADLVVNNWKCVVEGGCKDASTRHPSWDQWERLSGYLIARIAAYLLAQIDDANGEYAEAAQSVIRHGQFDRPENMASLSRCVAHALATPAEDG